MCGVVGYIGQKSCVKLVFDGLKRLEYRGYDSAGIATLDGGRLHLAKSEGKLQNLEPFLAQLPSTSKLGMGHTRWATHGAPTTDNAHPHVTDQVALIHNGIIENYQELKDELIAGGTKFNSQTDTEVMLHLLTQSLLKTNDMKKSLIEVIAKLHGAYAFGIIWVGQPDALYVVKQGSPVVLGEGDGENYFASDAISLLPLTNKILFLADGDIAKITKDKIEVMDFKGVTLHKQTSVVNIAASAADKGAFRHYMLKEIHEQPAVVSNTLSRLVDFSTSSFNEELLGLQAIDFKKVKHITYVACGTAFYSAMIAKYSVEQNLGIPITLELASEFRNRDPFINADSLVIAVTQSGETADTLACIKNAKAKGSQTMSVCNVKFSSIPRETHATLYMEAGPEIGVASTKAFTSMVLCHLIFGLAIGKKLGRLTDQKVKSQLEVMRQLPSQVDRAINAAGMIEELASQFYEAKSCLFLGRGPGYMAALEGALKLKEISYIHAEGYAGGELKHGPIALIDKHMPVVAIASKDEHYEKMISNVQEVRARQGKILGIGDLNDKKFRDLCEWYIPCPQIVDGPLQAILSTIPLQLFSYYVAVKRGTDVDQPRNLAKSVTVE